MLHSEDHDEHYEDKPGDEADPDADVWGESDEEPSTLGPDQMRQDQLNLEQEQFGEHLGKGA
jgi:hypothetical protein